MCRSIPFDYEREEIVHGLTGYRFSGGLRALDNGHNFPDNACYGNEDDQPSFPSGVMNISACRYGSPVFMSFPHYFAGDSFYVNEVEGLEPNKEKHQSYFTLEPVSELNRLNEVNDKEFLAFQLTGAPLEVTIRFQANFHVQPIDELSIFQEVPKIFMPAMWFEQKFVMDEEMAKEIKVAVQVPWIGRVAGLVLLAIGLALCAISSLIACIEAKKNSRRHQIEMSHGERKHETRTKKEVSPLLIRKPQLQVYRQRPSS